MKLDDRQKYILNTLFARQDLAEKNEEQKSIQAIIAQILTEDARVQMQAFESLCKFRAEDNIIKNQDGQFLLGFCYLSGIGTEQNYSKANTLFSAIPKYDYAQTAMGNLYFYGLGVEQNYAVAKRWYDSAKDQHNAEAVYVLAWMQIKGQGVFKRDQKQAIEDFHLAAQTGYPDAAYTVGRFYEQGRFGLKKDLKKSFEYYTLAAKANHAKGHLSLALCYERGQGIAADKRSAFEHWKRAAELGEGTAQCNLGMHYFLSGPQKYRLAFSEFQKSAKQNNSVATFNLAWMVAKGWGTEKDLQKAALLFQQALELHDNSSVIRRVLKLYREDSLLFPKIEAEEWTKKVQSLQNASYLNMSGAGITGIELDVVIKAIEDAPHLEMLDFSGNAIQDLGAEKITQVLLPKTIDKNSKIKTLRLAGCDIGDKAAAAIAKMLETNTDLQSLDLSGNKLTSTGIMTIIKGISQNPKSNLQALWLMDNEIHRNTFDAIVTMLDKNKTLRIISLGKGQDYPLIFGGITENCPSYQKLKQSITMPYFNFFTSQASVEGVMTTFHERLVEHDRTIQHDSDESVMKFLNYPVQDLKAESEQEYLKKGYDLYCSAIKAIERNWYPSHQLRMRQFKAICKKVVVCSQNVTEALAIEWLTSLPRVENLWMAEAQLEVGKLYKENASDQNHLSQALKYFEKAARNFDFKAIAQQENKKINELLSLKQEQIKQAELAEKHEKEKTQVRLIVALEEQTKAVEKKNKLEEEALKISEKKLVLEETKIKIEQDQVKLSEEHINLAKESQVLSKKQLKLKDRSNNLREKNLKLGKKKVKALESNTQAIEGQSQAIENQTEILRQTLAFHKDQQKELEKGAKQLETEYEKKIAQLREEWEDYKKTIQADQKDIKESFELDLKGYEENLRNIYQTIQNEIFKLKDKLEKLEGDFEKNDFDKKQMEELKIRQQFLLDKYFKAQANIKRKKVETEKQEEIIKLFQEDPSVYRFYRILRLRLHAFFHGYQTLASEQVKREENTLKDKIATTIKTGLGLLPLPGAGKVGEVLGAKLSASADRDVKNLAERVTELALNHARDNYVEETASGLTRRYIEQLQCLTVKSADRQAVIALEYIKKFISTAKEDELANLAKDRSIVACFMDSVVTQELKLSKILGVGKETLEKRDTKKSLDKQNKQQGNWNYASMFKKSGIKVFRNDTMEYYTFTGCRAEKYGYRCLTARQLKVMKTRDPSLHLLNSDPQKDRLQAPAFLTVATDFVVPPLLWSPRQSISIELPASPHSPSRKKQNLPL